MITSIINKLKEQKLKTEALNFVEEIEVSKPNNVPSLTAKEMKEALKVLSNRIAELEQLLDAKYQTDLKNEVSISLSKYISTK